MKTHKKDKQIYQDNYNDSGKWSQTIIDDKLIWFKMQYLAF